MDKQKNGKTASAPLHLRAKGMLLRTFSLTPQKAIALSALRVPAPVRFLLADRLHRFGYKRSAVKAMRAIPLQAYPERLQTQAALLIGQLGADPDVEKLMADICDRLADGPDFGVWSEMLAWYAKRSSLPDDARFAAVERLAAMPFADDKSAPLRQIEIAKARIDVRMAANIDFDVLSFLPDLPKDRKLIGRYIPFIRPLRVCGHKDEALAILDALKAAGDKRYLLETLRNYPGMVDPAQIKPPGSIKEQVRVLQAMSSVSGLTPAHKTVYDQIIAAITVSFPHERLKNRYRIIALLMKLGLHDAAIECLALADDPQNETLMSVRRLRAWEKYYAFDFTGAAADFEKILFEAPKNPDAASGLRFSLARCGLSMSDIHARITDIAGAPPVDTEANVWRLFELGDFAQLGRVYQQGKRWQALYRYLGPRIIQEWPSDQRPDKSLLFIADQGVGDEIRQFHYYDRLVDTFGEVHVTCDPRLQRILAHNFPDITFHPVWRTRLGLSDRISRAVNRIKGFSGGLHNLLSEDIRPVIDSVDFVANHSSLQIATAEGRLPPPDRAAVITPPDGVESKGDTGKLRVGVVWRSSLFSGSRRLMYLAIEDLGPLFEMDGIDFHCIQHALSAQEQEFCDTHGVTVRRDIDMYDDFDAMSSYIASLDLVIGISTVPAELAAALGVPVWFMGFSPENLYLRTLGGKTETDQLTKNAIVIGPDNRDFNRSPQDCIADTVAAVQRRLGQKLATPDS